MDSVQIDTSPHANLAANPCLHSSFSDESGGTGTRTVAHYRREPRSKFRENNQPKVTRTTARSVIVTPFAPNRWIAAERSDITISHALMRMSMDASASFRKASTFVIVRPF